MQCLNIRILFVKRVCSVSGIFATSFRVWKCNFLRNKKPVSLLSCMCKINHLQKVPVYSERDLWLLDIKWLVDNGAFVDHWTFLKACCWDLSESLSGLNLCKLCDGGVRFLSFLFVRTLFYIWINRCYKFTLPAVGLSSSAEDKHSCCSLQ